MEKTFILCLLTLTVLGVHAQKKGKVKELNVATMLQSTTDSLAYVLGQNMAAGLDKHLATVGVLKDTTADALIENYTKQFSEANENQKAKLAKELAGKKKEVEKMNADNLVKFLSGVNEVLSNNEVNPYNVGLGIGNQLADISKKFEGEVLTKELSLNKQIYAYSIEQAINGKQSIIEDPQGFLQKKVMAMQQAKELEKAEELKALHGDRITSNTKFLTANKEKQGVITLPSGLQYKIVVEGAGAIPANSDRVTVHYEGRLVENGDVFDSSYKRGEPATFGVTQVIKGWVEALQLMPVGSKWTIYIPYDLAYGEQGGGDAIPPFSALEFDIELIDIEK